MIVNLDPANDRLPYEATIDIRDYITLEEIMDLEGLGPNGGMVYALEVFEEQLDDFLKRIRGLIDLNKKSSSCYLIFDSPGQVELYTNHHVFNNIYARLIKELDFRMCVVNLVDSNNILKPSQYISILLLSLRAMLQMDLPQVNVLSKIDLLKQFVEHEPLPFDLNYYTEVQNLNYLIPHIETEENNPRAKFFKQKHLKLSEMIAEMVEDYNLIQFEVLSIEDKNSMINLLSLIDKSNGYAFGNELGGDSIWQDAIRQSSTGYMQEIDIQERWIDHKDEWDQLEAEKRKELIEEMDQQDKELDRPIGEEEEWEMALKQWEESTGKSFLKQ